VPFENTVMRRKTTFRSATHRIYDGGRTLWKLVKLIVEENYLPEQMFNLDETSVFRKRMPEMTFIYKKAKSMSGFKPCDVHSVTFAQRRNRLTTPFLRTYPRP